jgi:hypothetical protein
MTHKHCLFIIYSFLRCELQWVVTYSAKSRRGTLSRRAGRKVRPLTPAVAGAAPDPFADFRTWETEHGG